mgnify:CR=1 FL=1
MWIFLFDERISRPIWQTQFRNISSSGKIKYREIIAKVFTGQDGKIVPLKDTIASFKGLLAGEYDHLPEQAFYMVGSIDEALEKAK